MPDPAIGRAWSIFVNLTTWTTAKLGGLILTVKVVTYFPLFAAEIR